MGEYFSVTASGSGVSGNILPHSGTVTFTIKMIGPDNDYIGRYLYTSVCPTDENNNVLTEDLASSDMGASMLSYEYINNYNDTTKYASVDMAKFKSACSAYSNLAGLRFLVHTNYSEYEEFYFSLEILYTACTGPSWCSLDEDLSREAVTLRWGAGTPGTNNPIDHYEVWRAEMASPDAAYPEDWDYVGSTTRRSMDVNPPDTVGRYYLFSVWAVGANYHENADSEWCDSSNLLRRKWDAFGAWTDATLTARVTPIRAVHLTQIQERIATIRSFYGLSAYTFTAITARQTKIAKWAALIGELRSAIDGITTNHESWNTLEAGKPRIAHITQLRSIIDNM